MRVLVTGSSRGIGLGLCEAYAERGDEVIAACRRSTPALAVLGVQVVEGIELTSDEAVAALPAAVGPSGLDVLICNAAIYADAPSLAQADTTALAHMYDVNALGVVRTVLALLPTMGLGSKITLVGIGASMLHLGHATHPVDRHYGYRMSKAAMTSFGFGLGHDLRDRGIAVLIASPGPVDTDMLRNAIDDGQTSVVLQEARSPLEVGRLLRDRTDELALERSPAWQQTPRGDSAVDRIRAQTAPHVRPT